MLELYSEGADALAPSIKLICFLELSMRRQCLFYQGDCPFE